MLVTVGFLIMIQDRLTSASTLQILVACMVLSLPIVLSAFAVSSLDTSDLIFRYCFH